MQISHRAARRRARERAAAAATIHLIEDDEIRGTRAGNQEGDAEAHIIARVTAAESARQSALAKTPFKPHSRVLPCPPVREASIDPSSYPVDGQAPTRVTPKRTLGVSRFRKTENKYNVNGNLRKRQEEKNPDTVVDAYVDDVLGMGEKTMGKRIPTPEPLAQLEGDMYDIAGRPEEVPRLYAPNKYDTLPPYATTLALDRRERTDGAVRRALQTMRRDSDCQRHGTTSARMSRQQFQMRPPVALCRNPASDPGIHETCTQDRGVNDHISGTSESLPNLSDVLSDLGMHRRRTEIDRHV